MLGSTKFKESPYVRFNIHDYTPRKDPGEFPVSMAVIRGPFWGHFHLMMDGYP